MELRLKYKEAAVDFLLNISFDGYANEKASEKKSFDFLKKSSIKKKNEADEIDVSTKSTVEYSNISGKINSIKARKVLDKLSHKSRKRTTSSSSLSTLTDDKESMKTTKQRLAVVSPTQRSTISVYSILGFNRRVKFVKHDGTIVDKPEVNRSRLISGTSNSTVDSILAFGLLQIPADEDVSYQHLLKPIIYPESKLNLLTFPPKMQSNVSPAKKLSKIPECKYDPNLLDDPEMISSRNKVVLDLPGYLTTIVNYVKPNDIKSDINEQFRQKFPEINLTLTKLRSLKNNIVSIANKFGIDLWTVATSFVYFETLVLKNLICKSNRRLCCAASFLLSAKLNDVKGTELAAILQELESTFKIHKKEILQFELYVFVGLEFGLLLPDRTVNVHYKRLMITL